MADLGTIAGAFGIAAVGTGFGYACMQCLREVLDHGPYPPKQNKNSPPKEDQLEGASISKEISNPSP